ncbi:hypothetical protein C8K66_11467 [Pseudomonas sp. GV105]|uniref:ABC-three component system middle component 1 n=1 Tax=Pseudomonas sp. GV105 TaxID=2135759 RepID=UPI000D3C1463|nr:ABC-three component system middle component 1 [Pseudomonas sp. GV105]PUB25121.1 hypothetical protein C8K66_11467 [Pseudomonas sp. GV105]
MIKILKNIMVSNGLVVVDVDVDSEISDFYLYRGSSSQREEYFLVLELTDTSNETLRKFLDEKAQEIFEDIQKSGKVEIFFEKNCTMLICINSEKLDPELVLALEEDPYNFKKNVIIYSDSELAELDNYLVSRPMEAFTGDMINDVLNANDGRDFLAFKYQRGRNVLYDLVIRVVLKLPFLVYKPREQKLENLSEKIDEAISDDNYEIFNHMLKAEWTDENVLDHVESIWGDKI